MDAASIQLTCNSILPLILKFG